MSTSFYSVRIKVIEFINKHKELLLQLYNVICNDESLLILGLCLKPNLCRSIQRGSELKENDTSIFNEEYKIEEKIFAKKTTPSVSMGCLSFSYGILLQGEYHYEKHSGIATGRKEGLVLSEGSGD